MTPPQGGGGGVGSAGGAPDPVGDGLRKALAGQYRVERELGRGAMARVFLARDLRHDRAVAVKVLPPELATASNAERFLREIRITAVLQHPNILPLLDSGAATGLCWYVMPHVEGHSLREKLEGGPLPVGEALRIAAALARTLGHAHDHGVIHRDIKPENVLFSSGQPMVADFGLARAVAGSLGTGLTAAGLPLGTPAYMSPEQVQGSDRIDHRTDLYALGCILFEMLTGKPPFTGSVGVVMRQHMQGEPPAVSSVRAGVPAPVDRIVARLLAKDPDERYQAGGALAADLEMAGARETVGDGAPPAPEGVVAGASPPLADVPASSGLRGRRMVAAVVVVALTAGWLLGRGGGSGVTDGRSTTVMLAVPAGDAEAQAVASGLAEALGAVGGDRAQMLRGQLRREGDRLVLTLELLGSRAGNLAWSGRWDVQAGTEGTMAREAAAAAAEALRAAVGNR